MARKQFFCIVDTETTMQSTVADFGAIIVDRKGEIYKQCAVLVKGEFDAKDLFYDNSDKAGHWSYDNMIKKRARYVEMLNSGVRMLASVNAINKWLDQAIGQYNPMLTAYNLAFDVDKCGNTGINLEGFSSKFCLWQAANTMICDTKNYKQFILENHLFNSPTKFGNMTYQTNAESVCGYLKGAMTEEPHTALEDARDFELPILQNIVNRKGWRNKTFEGYNWRERQVKDHFTAK